MRNGLWLPLLFLFILLGTILHAPWLVFFATAVAFLLVIAEFWRRNALKNVSYRRRWVYKRGFPGETTDVNIEVENRKRLPLSWLRITDNWPAAVPPEDRSLLAPSHMIDRGLITNLFSLRGNQKASRSFHLKMEKRGIHPVGPVEMESGDLFGIYEETRKEEIIDTLTVFPEILPLTALGLPAEDPFGDRQAPRRLFEDPNRTIGVRAYHPEDEIRRIHWPATARTGQLQVRIYQPVSSRVLMVCMNASTTEHFWQGTAIATFEQLIKISATLAYEGIHEGYSVGLVSNGSLSRADHPFRILPGRSENHLALILQALAGVSPITIAPFETFLLKTMPEVPMGATLVVVTALITPSLVDTLVALKRYRAYTTLISLDPAAPPEIPGVRVVHLPFQEAQ